VVGIPGTGLDARGTPVPVRAMGPRVLFSFDLRRHLR